MKVGNSGLWSSNSWFSHFQLRCIFSRLEFKIFKFRGCFGNRKTSIIRKNHSQVSKNQSRDMGALQRQNMDFISMIIAKCFVSIMSLSRPKKVTMKLLKDSLSNGPYLVSCPLAWKVTRTLNFGAIGKSLATGIKKDPVGLKAHPVQYCLF